MSQAARFLVSGKVQGVWFRAHAREQALALGLHGHAVNLEDGRVEVLAVGDTDAIDALEHWLWQGSPLSEVEQVQRQTAPATDAGSGFTTG